jgi:hypothetical protein
MLDYLKARNAEIFSRVGYGAIAVGGAFIGASLIWPEMAFAGPCENVGEPLLAAGLIAWLIPGGPKA